MPSTAALEQRANDAARDAERIRRERVWDVGQIRSADYALQSAERNVEDGKLRDQLQAERPEGCWCLGTGGKGRRWTQDQVEIFDTYCACPEGDAARDEGERERDRVRAERERLRIERLTAEAHIPARFAGFTFAGFPATDATRETVQRVREWVLGPEGADDESEASIDRWRRWREDTRGSLLLWGPFGTGKTGLAVAALKAWVRTEQGTALFATVPALLDSIRRGYDRDAEERADDLIERVKGADFLVLDDLGAERATDWVAERLFVIVNHRHDENLATVFTSNLSPEQLAGHVGERTMWRIIEMCDVIRVDGPNLRDRRG